MPGRRFDNIKRNLREGQLPPQQHADSSNIINAEPTKVQDTSKSNSAFVDGQLAAIPLPISYKDQLYGAASLNEKAYARENVRHGRSNGYDIIKGTIF